MFIDELKRLVNPALADSLLVHSATEGTGVIPFDDLPKLLNAGNLKMPGSDISIADYYRSFSNRNLLDNWYFPTAVNQLGQNTYGPNKNGIDRWRTGISVSVELTENGLKISRDGETGTSILQRLEHDRIPLDTVVTYSQLLANGTLLTATGKTPKEIPSTGYAQTILIDASNSLALLENGVWQITCGCITDKTSKTVVAVKFEFGPFQTLAHREGNKWVLNDPPPNYAEELAKCQRYQYIANEVGNNIAYFGQGTTDSTNSCVVIAMPIPDTRAFPAISSAGNFELSSAEGDRLPVTGISTYISSRSGFIWLMVKTSGTLTKGRLYRLCAKSDKTARVILDANL